MLAEKTGCVEFHSSLRSKTKSAMQFIHPAFEHPIPARPAGGTIGSGESYMNNAIDAAEVSGLKSALD